jgi:hypothetical protein
VNIYGKPTISAAFFGKVLADAKSPVLFERPAAEYYDAFVAGNLDPAFGLAIFCNESTYGTAPTAIVNTYQTKNWCNARSLRKPGLHGIVVSTPRGNFVRYDSWLDGVIDMVYRLTDKTYAYAGKTTVEAVVPVMAPPGDFDNDPTAYVRKVIALMTAWAAADITKEQPVSQYADSVQLIPETNSNRPGDKLVRLTWFVIHETDNENPGAGATNTRDYVFGKFGPPPDASFHFVADADQSIQLLPVDELCWAIGDGSDQPYHDASYESLSIEICVNNRARQLDAYRKGADVVAKVLVDKGLGIEAVRQHGSFWSPENPAVHKGCPKHLQAGDWGADWAFFLQMVQTRVQKLQGDNKVVIVPPKPVEEHKGDTVDTISAALNAWYATLPAELQGSKDNGVFYEANIDFSTLYPHIVGPQRAIVGEYCAAWFYPDGHILPIFPRDRVRLEDAGKIVKR